MPNDEALKKLIDDLNAPVHKENILDGSQTPGPGEFALDESWKIVVASEGSCAHPVARHFAGFLSTCFGLELPVVSGGGAPAIVFCEEGASSFPSEESYRIEAAPTGITLHASGVGGFWEGVVYLEKRTSFRRSPILPEIAFTNSPLFEFRIHRSFYSPMYEYDLFSEVDPYPEDFLCRLAHYSVNGIWVYGLLRDLVPSGVFEGFGAESGRRVARLNELIERAARYGIKVYFYMTEPRGFPENHEFWEKYPHVKGELLEDPKGTMWGSYYALCTSTSEVKEFLRDSSRELFLRAPGLGGLILITASEQHTHCYSHIDLYGSGIDFVDYVIPTEPSCPRCRDREAPEVVSEVVNLIEEGVHSVDPGANVIAWNWSWTMLEPEPHKKIISLLSPNVFVMGGFERGGQVTRFGKTVPVDEYSLSYIGPSPRFLGGVEAAREGGRKVAAKVQIVATHEMATSGYMPLPYNVYEKYCALRRLGVNGVMQTWNFANYPSPSLEVAGWYSWSENDEDIDWLLRGILTRDYGEHHVEDVLEVYEIIRQAFDYFPMHQGLMSRSPVNRSPAYPFNLVPDDRPMALSYLHDDSTGDSLVEGWMSDFTPEETARCFEAVADEAENAMPILDRIEQDPYLPCAGRTEVAVCRAVYHQARSAALLMGFILERNRNLGAKREGELTDKLADLAQREIAHLGKFVPYVEHNHILGFHGEAMEHLYDAEAIREKIRNLEQMLA